MIQMSSSTTATSKKLHYASLHAQLDRLNDNVLLLNKNIQVMADQVPSIQKIGVFHTAM
jgi:hypothetical protein